MGVHCEINLHKPSDGVFRPGSKVSGIIKYAVDEDTVFNKITVALKGSGRLMMRRTERRNNRTIVHVHRNSEDYFRLDHITHSDQNGEKILPRGQYETKFEFDLPENIPSTLHVFKNVPRYVIRCHIEYFLSIKFERPGLFKFDKKFRKEITIVSGITPKLPTVPTVCGEQKTLTQLFKSKKSIVNIKATIQTCVLRPGDKINFEYEVNNDTNVTVKGVKTKLIEVYTFTSRGGRQADAIENIIHTDSKTGSIKAGNVQNMTAEIATPFDRITLENSNMVVRNYYVVIKVNLPFPHRDAVCKIPVQIGEVYGVNTQPQDIGDAPPSYWEVMAEDSGKDKLDEDNDDGGDVLDGDENLETDEKKK